MARWHALPLPGRLAVHTEREIIARACGMQSEQINAFALCEPSQDAEAEFLTPAELFDSEDEFEQNSLAF